MFFGCLFGQSERCSVDFFVLLGFCWLLEFFLPGFIGWFKHNSNLLYMFFFWSWLVVLLLLLVSALLMHWSAECPAVWLKLYGVFFPFFVWQERTYRHKKRRRVYLSGFFGIHNTYATVFNIFYVWCGACSRFPSSSNGRATKTKDVKNFITQQQPVHQTARIIVDNNKKKATPKNSNEDDAVAAVRCP